MQRVCYECGKAILAGPNSTFLPVQADRGFARLRLCTNKDGNTNNLVLYTVRNGTSKKGGNAPRATDLKRKRGVCRYFNPPQASLK